MPLFRYEAVNAAGELVKESVEAPSQEAVVKQVQDQGLLLITVQEAGASALIGLNQPLFGKRYRVSQKELVILTEEMAKLLGRPGPGR